MSEPKLLDFIVIGAPKAGTTSLFHYLQAHPSIFMPSGKEIPFFSDRERFQRGWNAFAREYFASAGLDQLWGKVTPQYMSFPEAPQRIHELMPNAKLIALLRNPIDRSFSHYRMAVIRGWTTRSFEEAVEEEMKTSDHVNRESRLLGRSGYARILKRYFELFEPQQILIRFTEDMEKQPQFVLDSVLQHIGLKPGFRPSNLGKHYHAGGAQQKFPAIYKMSRRILKRVWNALPPAQGEALKFWFEFKFSAAKEEKASIAPAIREKLASYYREEVLELQHLINQTVPWKEFRREH